VSAYKHKRLLKLVDMHLDAQGEISAKLIDPAIKKGYDGYSRCEGKLHWILLTLGTHRYLVEGVRRDPCHVVILSGHGDIGPIGCMENPSDSDMRHALKEDPGVLLQVIEEKDCPVCAADKVQTA
jgi:hypothetical protein